MARLGNINLFVRDIAQARRFYTEALGLTEMPERSAPPSFALLDAGGCTITLQDAAATGAIFGSSDSVELGFAVADVEAAGAALRAWGVEVSAVQQMGWGSGLDARDPDGYRLTVYRMREA